MDSPPAYPLPPGINSHSLRNTPDGITYLKAIGRFRPYMQERIDSKNRPFLAWDGEGWSDNDGLDHHYMLFGNSQGTHIKAPELTSIECLQLLLQVAGENPKAIHIWYGGGYDVTHILRNIPLDLTSKLRDNNTIHWNIPKAPGQAPNTFSINYVPHKWFEVKGYDWSSTRWVTVRVYDIMTYFQTSAIKAWESRKLVMSDAVRSGKASRSDFTWDDIDEVLDYMTEELALYVELANTLRQEMQDAGVYVTQWHGPATIAKSFMRKHKIKQYMQVPEPHIERIAQHAYFGGHFEQYKAGHYDGRVYLYDINSAYPHHIRTLPDMAGATWSYTRNFTGQLGMWRCRYVGMDNSGHLQPNPTPWRGKSGAVGFPTNNTETWLWTPEATIPGVEVIDGYVLQPGSEVKPFAYITELYGLRKQWQEIGRGGEKALKLGLNSSYGVMAQRIGGIPDIRGGRPAYHQLEWAGLVTSSARRQLWDAISQAPDTVIAVETDSIMTTEPLDLDIDTGLGQWGLKVYDYATYVQNGIYFTGTESGAVAGKPSSKTRGIDATKLDYAEVMAYLGGDQTDPLLVSSRNFIGLGNPRTQLYGMWQDSTKEVRVAGQKRIHSPANCGACANGLTMAESLHDLIAAPHYGLTPSTPHPLPWLDGTTPTDNDEPVYAGDVIEEYERERHI